MKARSIWTAATALLITLIAVEIMLRVAGLIPISSAMYRPDAEIGFRLQPGETTDAEGFKNTRTDTEPAPARISKPGTVLFVGDSFTFGTYPVDAVFPSITVSDLAASGLAERAINVGIPGAGPDTYVRVMRSYVPRLKPAAVVVTIYLGNDVEQGDPHRPTKLWLGRIGNYGHPLSLAPDELMIVDVSGKLLRLVEQIWHKRYISEDVSEASDEAGRQSPPFADDVLKQIYWRELQAAGVTPRPNIARGYDGLTADLSAMSAIARENGAKFLVVLAPSQVEINTDLRQGIATAFDEDPLDFEGTLPARRLSDALTARHIPFVDLAPALIAAGPASVYNRADTHWNRRGNAIAAHAIAASLETLLAKQ